MNYVEMYEDWYNNYLTVTTYANHHGLSIMRAYRSLKKGKILRESRFGSILRYA